VQELETNAEFNVVNHFDPLYATLHAVLHASHFNHAIFGIVAHNRQINQQYHYAFIFLGSSNNFPVGPVFSLNP
jgi:hypothetical protein